MWWLLLLFCATSQASLQSHPVLRHIGRWSAPPQQTPSSKQVSVVDAPLLGNGDLGITTAPHRDSYPLSSTSTPANQTFWVGKNDFWSAATVIDGTVEDLHCQLPYTILSIGGVTLSFPSVQSTSSYAATQNLSSARITTTTIGSDGRVLGTEGFVSANSNVLSLHITCDQGGCGDDGKEEIVTVKLWATKGDVSAPQDQMNCGGTMPRHGYIFPTNSGVSKIKNVPKGVWVTRDSVPSVANSCVLTTCRDNVNDGFQLFSLDNVTGQITLKDGRRLHTIQETDTKKIRITARACGTPEKKQEKWVLTKGQLVLVSNRSSSTCLEVTEAAPHAHLIFCNSSVSKWTFDIRTFQLMYTTTKSGTESNLPLCLTAVNDNRLTRAAMSMTVSAETHVAYHSHRQQSDSSASFKVKIKQGQPAIIILAVVTSEELDQTISSVVSTAETLSTVTSKNLTGLKQEHTDWWQTFWNKSWVDLDVDRGDGDGGGVNNSLLESYYYGSQYILGSSSRKGKIAPGLFGPWNTNDAAGWNGDYTLNYNFQSPYYGVYSDNRPELAEPFFDAIDSLIELGKRRAKKISWSKGSKGFSGLEIDDYGAS